MLVFLSRGCLSLAEWFHHLQMGFWTGRLINPRPLEATLWQLTRSWECSWLETISHCPESGFGQSTIYEWDAWAGTARLRGALLLENCHSRHSSSPLSTGPLHCQPSSIMWLALVSYSSASLLFRFWFYPSKYAWCFHGALTGHAFLLTLSYIPKDVRGCTHFQTEGLCNMLGVGDVNPQPVKWPSCVLLS